MRVRATSGILNKTSQHSVHHGQKLSYLYHGRKWLSPVLQHLTFLMEQESPLHHSTLSGDDGSLASVVSQAEQCKVLTSPAYATVTKAQAAILGWPHDQIVHPSFCITVCLLMAWLSNLVQSADQCMPGLLANLLHDQVVGMAAASR
jgi:hypothetical protein